MKPRFFFVGHPTVGSYVSKCLEPLGWVRVDDASQAAVAFSYCPSESALEDAYFDDAGLVKEARPGTLLVDLSPATPGFSREISIVASVSGLRLVEAPLVAIDVACPDAFGKRENMMCFAAGEDDDVDEVVDVLETIVGSVVRTGASGSAQAAKVKTTMQGASALVAAVEAEALAGSMANTIGLSVSKALNEPETVDFRQVLEDMLDDGFEATYTVEMLLGEVAAALGAADDVDLILPQLESVMHLLEVLTVIGGSDMPPASIWLLYRDEQTCARYGLDWTRAEGLYAEDDDEGYDDDGALGFDGGFGQYSEN